MATIALAMALSFNPSLTLVISLIRTLLCTVTSSHPALNPNFGLALTLTLYP